MKRKSEYMDYFRLGTIMFVLGNGWKTILEATTNGMGLVQKFKPVIAQIFRVKIENKDDEPTLSEWQLFSPE